MEAQFINSKLSSDKDDPDEWITQLEALCTCMNKVSIKGKSAKSDTDLMLHILANVLEAYEMLVNEMEMKIIADPSSVTIEVVCKKLDSRYTRIQKLRKSAQ